MSVICLPKDSFQEEVLMVNFVVCLLDAETMVFKWCAMVAQVVLKIVNEVQESL
jgi:hypothetical protein